jgi:hypothetical protein
MSEHVKAPSQDNKHIRVSISPVTLFKVPFSNFSYAFRRQEWFNLAREDVLRLRRTPPLVSFLVGRLRRVNMSLFTCGVHHRGSYVKLDVYQFFLKPSLLQFTKYMSWFFRNSLFYVGLHVTNLFTRLGMFNPAAWILLTSLFLTLVSFPHKPRSTGHAVSKPTRGRLKERVDVPVEIIWAGKSY